MKVNTTEITHEKLQNGRYCGACHDDKTAFSHQGYCFSCHSGDSSILKGKFNYFSNKPFPTTSFGNRIDWVQSLRRGLISPRRYLNEEPFVMDFDRTVELEAEMQRIPPAFFPHKAHLDWMSCDTCHPTIFNIKKKGTKHFSMNAILDGKFCGACHLNVAFPIDDCNRCHPKVKAY
jgi:c(7)-type cytochrome triheme protein